MTLRSFSLAHLVLLLCLSACKEQEQRPEDALKSFLADLQYRRAEHAWARLSKNSQETLLERASAQDKASGTTKKDQKDPKKLLFSDLGLIVQSAPEDIVVVSPIGATVKLRATIKGGQSAQMLMVKEGKHWKVDLLGSLSPAPALTEGLGKVKPPTPQP